MIRKRRVSDVLLGNHARPVLLGDTYISVLIISPKKRIFSGLHRIISDREWAHTVSPSLQGKNRVENLTALYKELH
jgi:hypothetical protein